MTLKTASQSLCLLQLSRLAQLLSESRVVNAEHCCAGILNLMVLILVCANARLIIENLMKYGLLLNPSRWFGFLLPDGAPVLQQCSDSICLLRAWQHASCDRLDQAAQLTLVMALQLNTDCHQQHRQRPAGRLL